MTSILVKDGLIKCPNCSNFIRSSTPKCTKCGLMAGEEGIRELAEIDEQNYLALSDAEDLILFSSAPLTLLIVAFVLSRFVPEFGVTPVFMAAVGLVIFWWKFFRWNQKYGEIEFPDDSFSEGKQKMKKALILGAVGSAVVILVIYSKI